MPWLSRHLFSGTRMNLLRVWGKVPRVDNNAPLKESHELTVRNVPALTGALRTQVVPGTGAQSESVAGQPPEVYGRGWAPPSSVQIQACTGRPVAARDLKLLEGNITPVGEFFAWSSAAAELGFTMDYLNLEAAALSRSRDACCRFISSASLSRT
jgi:hypothetical protein